MFTLRFIGKVTNHGGASHEEEPLSIENTVWANTVIASMLALSLIVYISLKYKLV